MKTNISIYLTLILILTPVYLQDPCDHPLTLICNTDNPEYHYPNECQPNAVFQITNPICRCVSEFYFDPNQSPGQMCQPCHTYCRHLTCVGPLKEDCTESSSEFYLYSVFSDLGKSQFPEKNKVFFRMNHVCSGLFLKFLMFHTVT